VKAWCLRIHAETTPTSSIYPPHPTGGRRMAAHQPRRALRDEKVSSLRRCALVPMHRGLHASTFQLTVSTFCRMCWLIAGFR
jgi:hypothetical protein